MAQSTVFSQLIKLIPRTKFQELVVRHDGDARVRSLDCWTWFGALLFGQMTGHDSIRAIERVFAHFDKAYIDYSWLNHLNQTGVWFVTRMKTNCHYQILQCREHNRTQGLRADQTIRLTSTKGDLYDGELRRVSYRDRR